MARLKICGIFGLALLIPCAIGRGESAAHTESDSQDRLLVFGEQPDLSAAVTTRCPPRARPVSMNALVLNEPSRPLSPIWRLFEKGKCTLLCAPRSGPKLSPAEGVYPFRAASIYSLRPQSDSLLAGQRVCLASGIAKSVEVVAQTGGAVAKAPETGKLE